MHVAIYLFFLKTCHQWCLLSPSMSLLSQTVSTTLSSVCQTVPPTVSPVCQTVSPSVPLVCHIVPPTISPVCQTVSPSGPFVCQTVPPTVSLVCQTVPPTMHQDEPLISDVQPGSLRLSWRPAQVPSYLMDSVPITYSIHYQVTSCWYWLQVQGTVSH